MSQVHLEDARGKKIALIAHCLLNANAKVLEFARYPGIFMDVLTTLNKYDIGVVQLPCPETLYLGVQRWWHVKDLYDNPGFRKFCYNLSIPFADQINAFREVGYKIVCILGIDGSPTCGVNLTCRSKEWGGRPKVLDFEKVLSPGRGVWMEQLQNYLQDNKIALPPFYGLALDQREKPIEKIFQEFEAFLKATLAG